MQRDDLMSGTNRRLAEQDPAADWIERCSAYLSELNPYGLFGNAAAPDVARALYAADPCASPEEVAERYSHGYLPPRCWTSSAPDGTSKEE